jgi:hypothetical protein
MQATVVSLSCKTVVDFSNFALHETVINSILIRCIVFIWYKKIYNSVVSCVFTNAASLSLYNMIYHHHPDGYLGYVKC